MQKKSIVNPVTFKKKILVLLLLTPSMLLADELNATHNDKEAAPTQLESIKVTMLKPGTSYPGGLINREAQSGLLGSVNYMNNPYNVISYNNQFIDRQNLTSIGGFLDKYDASINISGNNNSSQREFFSIRGFEAVTHDMSINGLPGMVGEMIPTNGIETIEVGKGPSAMLNGALRTGSVAGHINLITKKAQNEPMADIGLSYRSRSRIGLNLDLGRRFGSDKQFGVRYNGSYLKGNAIREQQKDKNTLNLLALDFRNENFRSSVDLIVNNINYNGKNGVLVSSPAIGGASINGELPAAPNGKNNFDHVWSSQQNKDRIAMSRFEWDINDDIMAYGSIGYAKHMYGAISKPSALLTQKNNPLAVFGSYDDSPVGRTSHLTEDRKNLSAELGITGKFALAATDHQWSLATNYSQNKTQINADIYNSLPSNCRLLNIYHVTACDKFSGPPFMTTDVATKSKLFSFAVADNISLFNDKLHVILGVRHQKIAYENNTLIHIVPLNNTMNVKQANKTQSATTPSIGIVFKPINSLAIYGNYIEGLSRGEMAPPLAVNVGQILDPYKTKQIELGVKKDLGILTASAAIFQINKESALLHPQTGIFARDGEQKNKGLELNLFAEPIDSLRFMGSASWIDAKLTKYDKAIYSGDKVLGIPKFAIKTQVEWDIPNTNQLTALATVNHTGKTMITGHDFYSGLSVPTRVPAWTRVDLGLLWSTSQLLGKNSTIQFNVENVFNKKYWTTAKGDGINVMALHHAQPRSFLLSYKTSF